MGSKQQCQRQSGQHLLLAILPEKRRLRLTNKSMTPCVSVRTTVALRSHYKRDITPNKSFTALLEAYDV